MFYRDCLRVFSEAATPPVAASRPCKTEVSQAGKAEAMIRLAAQSEYCKERVPYILSLSPYSVS